MNLYTYVSNNPVKYIDPTGLAKCAAAKNYDKALDGLQMILDIGGFFPGIGDVLDAVNLGISIFRGNVLDSVFSAIAMIPGLGSAISTPLKAIFNAVGNASEITKSVTALGILFGGTSKIVSSLDGVSKSLKAFAKKIPTLISSLKNNYVLKTLIGKKQLDKIVSGVRSGVNSLISRTTQVISKVKTAVKKNIKEEAVKTKYRLRYNLQYFASNATNKINITAGKNFKDHFINHKKILEKTLGTKYSKYKTDGTRFLDDIGSIIGNGTVEYVGQGTLKKGTDICNIYRGNGMTVVTKPNGEFVTILEEGKGMDLGIQFIK